MGATKFGVIKNPQAISDHDKANLIKLTRKQLRMGLIVNGKSASFIGDIIAGMDEGPAKEAAIVQWDDTVLYERDHPLIVQLIPATGFSEAQIDAMWIAAANT